MLLTEEKGEYLKDNAYQNRRPSVEMITYARLGHIGGSLSMADLLAVLYFHTMKVDPARPRWEGRDRFILSKAHGSPGLYAALAVRGYFPIEEVYTYCELGGGTEGATERHPPPACRAPHV